MAVIWRAMKLKLKPCIVFWKSLHGWAVNGIADSSDDTVMLRCGWYNTLCEQNLAHNPQIWRWSRNTAIFCGSRLILNGLRQSGKRFYGQTHYFEIRPIKFQIEMWTSCYQLSVSAAGILYKRLEQHSLSKSLQLVSSVYRLLQTVVKRWGKATLW